MASRVTRSKKGLSNMMTRKIICDTDDDIKFHLISEEFDKVSAKVKGLKDNNASTASIYTISIDYFDNTTPNNEIKKTDIQPVPPLSNPPLLFCQVDVLHIHKDKKITYSLKGIFSLLKSYCLAEGNSAVLNNTEFKKDDLEYFLNIIYKCIVFAQATEKEAEAKTKFNTYAHFLFNVAKKVNLAVGDNVQNKANRIIELSMPIDIVKETFDMDKFERFINILAAVRFEYDRREKDLQEKINKFNLLGKKRPRFEQVVKKEEEEEPAVEEPAVEEPAVEEPAVEEPAVEEPAVEEPAVEEPTAEPQVKKEEPAAEEQVKKEPQLPNLPPFIYELIEGSTTFIQQIDTLNVEFSHALNKDNTKLPNSSLETEENKRRHEEIAKNLLMTVLIDMKEEQIREQLDNDLDEYFASRPLKISQNESTTAIIPAATAATAASYPTQQYYEQAVLCYNGVYTKQLLDHISGIITISDVDKPKADIFVELINDLIKNNDIQQFIRYSKLNEMNQYYDERMKLINKKKTELEKVKAVTAEAKIELEKVKAVTTTELEKVKNIFPEKQQIEIVNKVNKVKADQNPEIFLETIYEILESIAKSIISDMNYDYSNRNRNYNQYIILKNNYLSTFRNDLIENANCRSKLREMNIEYIDDPLISELCGSFGNKVCLGKRKEDQRGGSKNKKITLNGKKYKIHMIDGKKYITMDKKKVLLSDAKKAAVS